VKYGTIRDMKRDCVFLVIFVFCSCVLFAQVDPQALLHYNNGLNYYNANDFDSAIVEFTRAIDIYPEYAEAYLERGNCYDNKDDAQTALGDYLRAGQYDSRYLLFARGYECASRDVQNSDEAILILSQCIEQNINTFIAYIMRGNSYLEKNDAKNGINDYTAAIRLSPNIFQPYFNRGSAYLLMGNIDRAINDFLISAELCPDFHYTYYFLSMLYVLSGNTEKAEKMMSIFESYN